MRRALAIALLVALASTPAAAQESPPVEVRLEGLFGEGTLLPEAWAPVAVRVRNLTRRDLSGTLRVEVYGYAGASMRHEAPVDLPAGAERTVDVMVFASNDGAEVRAIYLADDRALATSSVGVDHAPGGESVVVLGDPPRLRQALLDLDVSQMVHSSHRQVRVPVGVVAFDAATGDPRLPDVALAYATVRVLVASAPVLERASAAQHRALGDWLRGGGRLLVFPRSDADVSRPWLRALVGTIATGGATEPGAALVPDDVRRFGIVCSSAQRTESFGCSAAVGFGRVFVADYDGTTEGAIASGAPRELVRSVLTYSLSTPALRPGRGVDVMQHQEWDSSASFGELRRALDPNEGFRPALGLVALVLLLYVIVVGPIAFRWVQKRNAPTLALLTTPAAALACLMLLLAVGYVGKGVAMRYRRVETLESVEGQRRVLSRRYTGYFSTRPGAYDLAGPRDGRALRIGSSAASGPIHRHGAHGVALADIRAGLWETVFIREDRALDIGGAIRFERDGRRLVGVVNDSALALRDAFVVDSRGYIYRVGHVAAGARAPIPRERDPRVNLGGPADDLATTASIFGVREEEHAYFGGWRTLLGPELAARTVPVLYARVEGPREAIGPFDAEVDLRVVRIVPRMIGAAVTPAPPPLETDEWGQPITPPAPAFEETPSPIDDPWRDAGSLDAVDGGAP